MLVAFYYRKDGIVQLMSEYAGYPFCTYQDVKSVSAICGGSNGIYRIEMGNGDVATIRPDILERRVN